MGIIRNQTSARLILQTDIDFSVFTITTYQIKYRKPSGLQGTWDATALTGGESLGKLYVDFSSSIKFDQSGTWEIWAYIVFSDGTIGLGKKIQYFVEE